MIALTVMMKLVLCVCLVVAAVSGEEFKHPFPNGYHIDVGIPLAEKIFKAEAEILRGSRISGGVLSNPLDTPYTGSVLTLTVDGGTSFSTTSLISSTRALWAAHCWMSNTVFGVSSTLIFGSSFVSTGGVQVVASNVVVHPDWNSNTIANDVAILSFDAISFSDTVQPIALPTGSLLQNDFAGVTARASGYGITPEGGFTQLRHQVDVTVITNSQCSATLNNIFESTLCTSGVGGAGTCTGDSGGPLTTIIGGQRVQIGITSFGVGCGEPIPSGYARVTSFIPWIQQQL